MIRRIAVLSAAAALLAPGVEAQSIRRNPGFFTYSIARNDDGSSALEPLGFTINLFGKIRSAVYVNNNGNLTFDSALATYTPFGLRGTEREIIAPFFADVDTRPEGSKLVTYGQDTINGRRAFAANYVDVGYYSMHTDKLNSFQVVLIERADQGPGDFDIEFNYEAILWETGDASGGVNGFGGTPASAGWSNGSDTSYELPGSLIQGAFLDGGPYSLVRQSVTGAVVNTPSSQSSARPGRLVFRARDGVISPGLVVTGGILPEATVGVPYSEAVTAAGAEPPYRWSWQPDVVAPAGLTLSSAGLLAGTPTTPGTYSFTLRVTGQTEDGEVTVEERGTLTVRQAAVRITTSCPLADAWVGHPYAQNLTAAGASGIVWSLKDPLQLPAGLALGASGLLAGTAQTPGTYMLELEAGNADGSARPARAMCRLHVNPAMVRLTSCALPRATVGVPFAQTLQPEGGVAPYTFAMTGDLPRGVALTAGGKIVGTPEYWGVWLFKITTTDDRGARTEQDCSMIVDPARFTTQVCPLPAAVTGVPYSASLGSGFLWSVVGTLPGGLTLNPGGSISGTPMVAGAAQFGLLATNAQGEQSMEACSLIVERGALAVSGCPLPEARVGEPYRGEVTGLGGMAPYLFSRVGGSLPEGLEFSPSGRFQGTPTVAGSYAFTLRLRDAAQTSTLQACRLEVRPAELRLTTACPLPDARAGEAYSLQLTAAGGQPPYRFSYGLLPEGLTGTPEGAISGKATRVGGRSFPLRVTDAQEQTSESACSLAVVAPEPPPVRLLAPPATVAPATTTLALTVEMASAYTAPVRGVLTLDPRPETAGTDPVVDSPDPQLAFANGQRSTAFTIPSGATRATVPVVSTGTVASQVAVTLGSLETSGAAVPRPAVTQWFRIPPAAPVLTSACYVRTNTERGVQLELRVNGISTTRELTRARLTIPELELEAVNLPVPPEFVFESTKTVNVDLAGASASYYGSPGSVRTGGTFALTVPVSLERAPAVVSPAAKLNDIQVLVFNRVGGSAERTLNACP